MTTTRELLTGALRLINVIQANEEPTAQDTDIALEALNALIDSKSNDLLNIHTITPVRFPLTPGQFLYTLGPALDDAGNATNADWVTERPMRLEQAKMMLNPVIVTAAPTPTATYTLWGALSIRNGYAGDVGVPGFVGTPAPFEVGPIGDVQTNDLGTYPSNPFLLQATDYDGNNDPTGPVVGVGTGTLPEASPMTVGTIRTASAANTNYYEFKVFFPAVTGDSLWVTAATFDGYDLGYTLTVVIGPSETVGERYSVTGSARVNPQTITVERLTDAGSR